MSSRRHSYAQTVFKDAINGCPVDQYGAILDRELSDQVITLRAAVLVLFEPTSSNLWGSLVHKNKAAPGVSRDHRLLAWFQACEAAGAPVAQIVEQECSAHRDFRSGIKSLLRSRALHTIAWWKGHGLERGLSLTTTAHRPTTLASLAVYYGLPDMAAHLLPGSTLDHPDVLWPRLWRKDILRHADRLASLLLEVGPAPADFLEHLPQSGVNLGNVDSVLSLSNRVIDNGNCSLSPAQATRCLAALAQNLRSPASLELAVFFLKHGADPGLGTQQSPSAMENAITAWSRSSLGHGLRTSYRRCVELLANATPADQVLALLTPQRVEELTVIFRGKQYQPWPSASAISHLLTAPQPEDDVAFLRRLVLGQGQRDAMASRPSALRM
jgi:hypothetical protein